MDTLWPMRPARMKLLFVPALVGGWWRFGLGGRRRVGGRGGLGGFGGFGVAGQQLAVSLLI
ncbi:MAG TPA: hypothetical protein VK563_22805, partial [Puia sp.]|nr:hypothetical protein [Puia sp.]